MIKQFVVYDTETSEVLWWGACSSSDFSLQAGPGQSVIEGTIDTAKQRIVNGRVVDKKPEEIEAVKPEGIEAPAGQRPARITDEQ